ncbi:hypothetical protein NYF23_09620 [SAR92 clade bacterium H455]|uniref:Chitin-binding type-2 domain-containing protein n=1 Tax=SAR92 clade bacterium H455 TaxID=2974818 RepID=A0ABY5TKH6_9GAMM|nr:hypothetical protein NYF23_09620 [SAR92 clade bacterium H455]
MRIILFSLIFTTQAFSADFLYPDANSAVAACVSDLTSSGALLGSTVCGFEAQGWPPLSAGFSSYTYTDPNTQEDSQWVHRLACSQLVSPNNSGCSESIYYYSGSCPVGTTFNSVTLECEPPPPCMPGEYSLECAKECPATGWSSKGSVGYGMLCPGEIPGAPPPDPNDPWDPDGWGCISNATVGACSDGPHNSGGTGDGGSGGPDTSNDPTSDPDTGSFSGAGGGTSGGSGGSGGGTGDGTAGADSDPFKSPSAGIGAGVGEESLHDYCLDNYYADSRCSDNFGITPDTVDLCPNGGVSHDVYGCDYSVVVTCPAGSFATFSETCIEPTNTLTPIAPPPTNLPPAPEIISSTRDTTTVETTCDELGTCTKKTVQKSESGEPVSTVAGGASCAEPPACSHSIDPVQCAILHQQWSTRCHAGELAVANCDAPLECRGNPIQCASLNIQRAQACEEADTAAITSAVDSQYSSQGLTSVFDMESDAVANGYELEKNVDLASSFDELQALPVTSGVCPADITIEMGGSFGDVVIDLSQFCILLTWVGYLVRLAASLIAFNMIFATIRQV